MPRVKRGSPDTAIRVIEELGTQFLLKESKVSKGTLSCWKRLGMPVYFEMYLRATLPKLNAWKA